MAARAASTGRIDKRAAILDAAFTVFARRGYSQACVQEIAGAAGVAKPTVYNHLADKESLFRHAMTAAADAVAAEQLAVVQRLRDHGGDLHSALSDVGYRLLRVHCADRSRALRWLTHGQVVRFPDLVKTIHAATGGQISEALADRFARFSLSGRIRRCDPAEAAEQFLALLIGPADARSQMDIRGVSATVLRTIACAAANTFVRAYEPNGD